MDNLRLKPYYSVIAHGADVVELRHGVFNATSFTLTDESRQGALYRLICRLDGSARPSQIAKEEGVPRSDVEGLVDHLVQLGVVEEGPSSGLDYYVEELLGVHANGTGARERPPTVAAVQLVGDPELASDVAGLLSASAPPGLEVGIVEEDQARILADRDVSWLADGIRFQEMVARFDGWKGSLLIAVGRQVDPIWLRTINRVCLELGVPWLHAVADGPFLLVGPLVLPRRTACYECFETRVAMNLRSSESYARYKAALVEREIRKGRIPLEPVLRSLLASHTAMEALNHVLTGSSCTVGKVLAMYLPTMELSFNEVLRLPGCPACGSVVERDEEQLYFDIRRICENGTAARALA